MYRTFLGSILSIITFITILSFAVYRLEALKSRDDYQVQLRDEVSFFTDSDRFGHEQGLRVAFGISNDYLNNIPEDPSIGTFSFQMHTWGTEENKDYNIVPVESKPCKAEDLPDRIIESRNKSLYSIS